MKRLAALILPLLVLAGCASAPPERPAVSVDEREELLLGMQRWALQGRALLRTEQQAGRVSVHWRQDDPDYEVFLRAPWGGGSVRLRGGIGGVMLEGPRGEVRTATDPQQLLSEYFPYPLPIDALQYWLRGLAEPGVPVQAKRDETGLIEELHQGQWRVEYRGYDLVEGLYLPSKLFLYGPDVELRLAITEWELGDVD